MGNKFFKFNVLFFLMIGLLSCKKEINSSSPLLKISVDSYEQIGDTLIFNVNDTVKFKLEGASPDILSFYSGEVYHDYAYVDKEQILDSKATLTFNFCRFNGSNGKSGRIFYSKDFNGSYDIESVKNAEWIDITERFNMPDGVPSQNNNSATLWYKSDNVDVSDLFEDEINPVYFAYYMFDAAPNIWRTTIRVADFVLGKAVVEAPGLSQPVFSACSNADACSFKFVIGEGWDANQNTSSLQATGFYWNSASGRPASLRDGYAISPPLLVDNTVNIGTAKAIPLKGVADAGLTEYTHVYNKEGVYEPVFIMKNGTIYDEKVAKQGFIIKVIEQEFK